jgi:hypothetical protein
MDVSIASYYIIETQKIKVAKWGTPKKYLKKKNSMQVVNAYNKYKMHLGVLN